MSISSKTPQTSSKNDQMANLLPVDWWKAPSPNSTNTHNLMLSTISEFLQTYPASEIAGTISLAIGELSLVKDSEDLQKRMNIISSLAEISAFVTMLSDLNADLAYQSLRDCNVRE